MTGVYLTVSLNHWMLSSTSHLRDAVILKGRMVIQTCLLLSFEWYSEIWSHWTYWICQRIHRHLNEYRKKDVVNTIAVLALQAWDKFYNLKQESISEKPTDFVDFIENLIMIDLLEDSFVFDNFVEHRVRWIINNIIFFDSAYFYFFLRVFFIEFIFLSF